jgi:hypothetical protein
MPMYPASPYIARAPYKAGVLYLPSGITLTTGSALAANSIRAFPWWVPHDLTISELYARVTTADAAGNCQFAVARDSVDRTPGVTVASSPNVSLNVTAPANITGALSSNAVLSGGQRVWLCLNSNSATAVYVGTSSANTGLFADTGTDSLAQLFPGVSTNSFLSATQTFGTWGDLSGLTWTRGTGGPNVAIGFKVSAVP